MKTQLRFTYKKFNKTNKPPLKLIKKKKKVQIQKKIMEYNT